MPPSRFLSAQCLAVDDDALSLKLVEAACRKLNLEFLKASDVHQMIDVGPVPRFAGAKGDIELPKVPLLPGAEANR